ncbi:MAG: hypothetical protein ABIL11_11360 [Chloroflexota bacterium]
MVTYFENQLRGYNIVLATLQAFSQDICRNCIGLPGAQTKVKKGLKKLGMDLEVSTVSKSDKRWWLAQIERCAGLTEALDVAEEVECQKTAGNCKVGSGCLCTDGAMELMKEITEPIPSLAAPVAIG